MIPVPSCAGCISTRAEPHRPVTAWCSVPFFSFTLKSLRRASSIAFCTATGTSRALPLPMPMPPSPSSSCCCILGWIFAMGVSLELQSTAARRFGERLDPPVVLVPGAVERHRIDPLLLRLGRDALADKLGGLAAAAALELAAHVLLHAGSGGEHLVAHGRGDLRVDVLVAAMHSEAHGAVLADPDPRLPGAPQARDVLGVHRAPYFFFVSLSTITSLT